MNPRPCPHPVHLKCLAKQYSHAKEFSCHRCVPLVSLLRRISGVEGDLDLKKEVVSRQERTPKKQAFDASDSAKLQKMLGAHFYEFQLEATKLKCVLLVESENSGKLLEAEFARSKTLR